jgi:N4-gp56 family major capsid protein
MSSDFVMVPKVWQDHIDAFFKDKLLFGQMALQDATLKSQPGETVTFPYFKQIGACEEPGEDESLTVDKLSDDSFSATVKEVGKAVGVKKKAFRTSATSEDRIVSEITSQMARRFAEKVDDDLIAEINTVGNYVTGYTAADANGKSIVSNLAEMKHVAFGDRANEAVAIYMHSLNVLDLLTDSTAGFLKADANDPFYQMPGFMGRILGMGLFETDKCPRVADVASKKAYAVFMTKANPYGILTAEDYMLEEDKDILARERVFAATMWYAVKAFHGKVSADDLRIARGTFATRASA